MKKKHLIFFYFLCTSCSLFAQVDIDLKIDAIKIIELKPNISAEIGMGNIGLEVAGSYGALSIGTKDILKTIGRPSVVDIVGNEIIKGQDNVVVNNPLKGLEFKVNPFWYFKPSYSLDGFKIGPYFTYQTGSNSILNGKRLAVGGSIGTKIFFTERLGIEISAGGGKAISSETTNKITTQIIEDVEDRKPKIKYLEKMAGNDLFISVKGIYRFGEGFQF